MRVISCWKKLHFFYKSTLYKNTKTQITQKIKNKLRTMTRLDTKKNFKGEK